MSSKVYSAENPHTHQHKSMHDQGNTTLQQRQLWQPQHIRQQQVLHRTPKTQKHILCATAPHNVSSTRGQCHNTWAVYILPKLSKHISKLLLDSRLNCTAGSLLQLEHKSEATQVWRDLLLVRTRGRPNEFGVAHKVQPLQRVFTDPKPGRFYAAAAAVFYAVFLH